MSKCEKHGIIKRVRIGTCASDIEYCPECRNEWLKENTTNPINK